MVYNSLDVPDQSAETFKRLLLKEFPGAATNSIFVNDSGELSVFVNYRIVPVGKHCKVFIGATEAGLFTNTKIALSWCVADKFKDLKTAREILELDTKIRWLSDDIQTRALLAEKSRQPSFREILLTKLESKIIQRKGLEKQLENRIKWTKYLQQKGFNNETDRSSPKGNTKANR